MSQMRIFVSHSSADNDFCQALVLALREAGADVWFDQQNLGIGQLHDTIMRELHGRTVFIVVLSKSALASRNVRNECLWAFELEEQEAHRAIVPVTAQPIERSDFNEGWLFLTPFKRIEAPGYQPYPREEAITRTLRELGLLREDLGAGGCNIPVGWTAKELTQEGKRLCFRKKFECAARYCERATQLEPGYFSGWYNLAWPLYELRHLDQALAACERALALSPNNSYAWNLKSYILGWLHLPVEALAAADRSVAINPKLGRSWAHRGVVLIDLGRYEEAVAAFQQALNAESKDPNDEAVKMLPVALAKLHRYEEALVAYDQYLAKRPNDAEGWAYKGEALLAMGRHAEALEALNHALALDSKDAQAWASRATALRALGRTKEAADSAKRARELGEN